VSQYGTASRFVCKDASIATPGNSFFFCFLQIISARKFSAIRRIIIRTFRLDHWRFLQIGIDQAQQAGSAQTAQPVRQIVCHPELRFRIFRLFVLGKRKDFSHSGKVVALISEGPGWSMFEAEIPDRFQARVAVLAFLEVRRVGFTTTLDNGHLPYLTGHRACQSP